MYFPHAYESLWAGFLWIADVPWLLWTVRFPFRLAFLLAGHWFPFSWIVFRGLEPWCRQVLIPRRVGSVYSSLDVSVFVSLMSYHVFLRQVSLCALRGSGTILFRNASWRVCRFSSLVRWPWSWVVAVEEKGEAVSVDMDFDPARGAVRVRFVGLPIEGQTVWLDYLV